jgi:CheY-like chemotaxis protein
VRKLFVDEALRKGLALEVVEETPVPGIVLGDQVRIRQVLLNLVGNAIKFTEQGSVSLAVHAQRAAPEAGADPAWCLRFEVRDTGIGMTSEQTTRLFKPFSQGDSSMSRKYGGNGLGLCVSRHLAQMMGGDICVDSQLGRGSTFSFTIKAAAAGSGAVDAEPRAPLPARPRAPGAAPGLRLAARVLLAEDVTSTQRLYSTYLERAGAQIDLAADGQAAYELALKSLAERRPYDVILMDMQMPLLDGYEATARLRQAGYTAPIVALTAHAMRGDRERCLAAGCDEYAAKPIDREDLVALCQSVMLRSGTAA